MRFTDVEGVSSSPERLFIVKDWVSVNISSPDGIYADAESVVIFYSLDEGNISEIYLSRNNEGSREELGNLFNGDSLAEWIERTGEIYTLSLEIKLDRNTFIENSSYFLIGTSQDAIDVFQELIGQGAEVPYDRTSILVAAINSESDESVKGRLVVTLQQTLALRLSTLSSRITIAVDFELPAIFKELWQIYNISSWETLFPSSQDTNDFRAETLRVFDRWVSRHFELMEGTLSSGESLLETGDFNLLLDLLDFLSFSKAARSLSETARERLLADGKKIVADHLWNHLDAISIRVATETQDADDLTYLERIRDFTDPLISDADSYLAPSERSSIHAQAAGML